MTATLIDDDFKHELQKLIMRWPHHFERYYIDKTTIREAINKVRKIYDEGYRKDEPFDGMDFAIDLLKELKL